MKLRRSKERPKPGNPKFESRASRLSRDELTDGIEQSVSNINAYWAEWMRGKDMAILAELRLTIEAAYVLTDYLHDAQEARQSNRVIQPARQVKRY